MPIAPDTPFSRRHLPHIDQADRTYFVTFTTRDRFVLPYEARDIALACCVHDHRITCWLEVAVVMPDHVHLVFTPYEEWTLARMMRRIKGNAARRINQLLGRGGALWQDESFDRIVRRHEDLAQKCEYIAANPVRAGLVARPEDYPWLWQEWRTGKPACPRVGKL